MTIYAAPGQAGSLVTYPSRYDNWIGGQRVAPVKGEYFENPSPINGKPFCEIARGTAEDIELALDAAHAAASAWGHTSATERANILLKIADRMEANLELLAIAETWDNGKPVRETLAADRANILLKIADRIEANLELLAYAETVDNGKAIRETLNADIPLTVDHFRYFAGCVRAQEGALSNIDENTAAYHIQEPLGVVGQIIPWNFPILMAAWKLAPALGAGNCVVLKPAESTPISILILAELIADLLPAGVLNIVNGYGREAGLPLATSKRIAKIAFTGSTSTGRVIAQAAANNLIPATLELGGKSPNVFFADVMDKDDGFLDKAIEGLVLFAFNQGEVCTCPSRALIQESIYDRFMERVLQRVAAIQQTNPLDTSSMMGAQASKEQLTKILSYLDLGKQEGAQVLAGGSQAHLGGELDGGYYVQPTLFKGHNKMRIFQEEIFGPVLAVTTFKDEAEALAIANDTLYGLGAGVWSRNGNVAYRMGRAIKAGRVWTNCYHAYPAHAAFGGYKESGIGRETHKVMLDHYQQTKNLLVSYSESKLGFF